MASILEEHAQDEEMAPDEVNAPYQEELAAKQSEDIPAASVNDIAQVEDNAPLQDASTEAVRDDDISAASAANEDNENPKVNADVHDNIPPVIIEDTTLVQTEPA